MTLRARGCFLRDRSVEGTEKASERRSYIRTNDERTGARANERANKREKESGGGFRVGHRERARSYGAGDGNPRAWATGGEESRSGRLPLRRVSLVACIVRRGSRAIRSLPLSRVRYKGISTKIINDKCTVIYATASFSSSCTAVYSSSARGQGRRKCGARDRTRRHRQRWTSVCRSNLESEPTPPCGNQRMSSNSSNYAHPDVRNTLVTFLREAPGERWRARDSQ